MSGDPGVLRDRANRHLFTLADKAGHGEPHSGFVKVAGDFLGRRHDNHPTGQRLVFQYSICTKTFFDFFRFGCQISAQIPVLYSVTTKMDDTQEQLADYYSERAEEEFFRAVEETFRDWYEADSERRDDAWYYESCLDDLNAEWRKRN